MLIQQRSTALYDKVMAAAVHLPNGQTAFRCSHHGFHTGPASFVSRYRGCEECILIYFLRLDAVTPPEDRERLADNLLRVMIEADKLAQKGDFDLHISLDPGHSISLDDTIELPPGYEPILPKR